MAIGQNSDVTTEAAGVVIMDNSLKKVDEFMHISRRMRSIALQSAVGGMLLSIAGMVFAASRSPESRWRRDNVRKSLMFLRSSMLCEQHSHRK